MASDMVTIDRAYFETLVRRADFNIDDPARASSSITVQKTEYDVLRKIARQYANLKHNLLRGGVDDHTIDKPNQRLDSQPNLLSQDDATIQDTSVKTNKTDAGVIGDGSIRMAVQAPPPAYHEGSRGFPRNIQNYETWSKHFENVHIHESEDWADEDPSPDSVSLDGPVQELPLLISPPQPIQRPQFDRQCTRTILLTNLAEGVTHADVTRVVRGGQLLDVYLRANDRTVAVSFLHAVDARAFFDHVKKNDLYIKNKRVEVRWSDRQFILPGHVANKIGIGATRNLIIRRCDPRITEESIRDDLEHIHNLVVIKVEFIGSSCFISTNSVHNAMFARTCMMSRGKYKGMKINWEADECAQALDRMPVPPKPPKEIVPPKKANNMTTNRFHLLNLDNDEDEFYVKNSTKVTA